MSPQRASGKGKFSRFAVDEESSPRHVDQPVRKPKVNELGLSQVDSKYAIDPSGGTVVVMQEFHDESAFDIGDFTSVLSKSDKRKQAQLTKEAEEKRKKEEEKKAGIAAKKAAIEEAARRKAGEEAAAKEAAAALVKKVEEEKRQKDLEAKKAARKEQREKAAAKKKEARKTEEAKPPVVAPPTVPKSTTFASQAILRDPAVAGIGAVISRTVPAAPTVVVTSTATRGTQTDPVRILPMEDPVSSAAAWWLQQQSPASAPPPTSSDQFMMQSAYMDAMQRMSGAAPPPGLSTGAPGPTNGSSNYGYWPQQQPSAADLYWQQQQNVYQGPPRQQYSR